MMHSSTDTWEAYTSGRSAGEGDREHVPAGRTWFCVILMSLPLCVVMCVKTALSLLALWGMKTTCHVKRGDESDESNMRI